MVGCCCRFSTGHGVAAISLSSLLSSPSPSSLFFSVSFSLCRNFPHASGNPLPDFASSAPSTGLLQHVVASSDRAPLGLFQPRRSAAVAGERQQPLLGSHWCPFEHAVVPPPAKPARVSSILPIANSSAVMFRQGDAENILMVGREIMKSAVTWREDGVGETTHSRTVTQVDKMGRSGYQGISEINLRKIGATNLL